MTAETHRLLHVVIDKLDRLAEPDASDWRTVAEALRSIIDNPYHSVGNRAQEALAIAERHIRQGGRQMSETLTNPAFDFEAQHALFQIRRRLAERCLSRMETESADKQMHRVFIESVMQEYVDLHRHPKPAPDALGERARAIVESWMQDCPLVAVRFEESERLQWLITEALTASESVSPSPTPATGDGMETTAEERAEWYGGQPERTFPRLAHDAWNARPMARLCRDHDRQSAEIARLTAELAEAQTDRDRWYGEAFLQKRLVEEARADVAKAREEEREALSKPNATMIMAAQIALHDMIWPDKKPTDHSWVLPVGLAAISKMITAAIRARSTEGET